MEIQVAVAKASQFSSSEGGDTLEVVERPNGGVSIVLCDANLSGREAKRISSLVVRKVISLLAEGVRDGAAARAASDLLFTEWGGKAAAYLNILSVDLQTQTLVVTHNNLTPVFVSQNGNMQCLRENWPPIGLERNLRPAITELPLVTGTSVVLYTDGISNAGKQYGQEFDSCFLLDTLMSEDLPKAQEVADHLLAQAIRLDQGRPNDDMSVVVLQVLPEPSDAVRRLWLRLPVIQGQAFSDEISSKEIFS
jgi:serine phosphatase RsbU (regulator of sigma subunit)